MDCKLSTLAVFMLVISVGFWWRTDNWNPISVAGRRIAITGASSELGREIAYGYCRLGARVILIGRQQESLRRVAIGCRTLGALQAEVVEADLFYRKGRAHFIEEVQRHFGGLDHLVLNHGSVHALGWWMGTSDNLTSLVEDYHLIVAGYADLVSRVLPMLTESRGHVGIVTSLTGTSGAPGLAVPAAVGMAVDGYFSALHQELRLQGSGVSVTTCYLGFVATAAHVRGRDLPASAVLPADAGGAVVRAVGGRARRLYYPWTEWLAIVVRKLFPGIVEDQFRKVVPQ